MNGTEFDGSLELSTSYLPKTELPKETRAYGKNISYQRPGLRDTVSTIFSAASTFFGTLDGLKRITDCLRSFEASSSPVKPTALFMAFEFSDQEIIKAGERIEKKSAFIDFLESQADWLSTFEADTNKIFNAGQVSEVCRLLKNDPSLTPAEVIKNLDPTEVCYKQMVCWIEAKMSESDADNALYEPISSKSNREKEIPEDEYEPKAFESNTKHCIGLTVAEQEFGYRTKSVGNKSYKAEDLNPSLFNKLLNSQSFSSLQINVFADTLAGCVGHSMGVYCANGRYLVYDPTPQKGFFEFSDLQSCTEFLQKHINTTYRRYQEIQLHQEIA